MATTEPVIIEAVGDPFEPPMPAKVESKSLSQYWWIKFANSSGRLVAKSARSTLHATKIASEDT